VAGTRTADRLLKLEFFLSEHGAVLDAALRAYMEDMTARGEQFVRQHDSAPAGERPGLLYLAQAVTESAQKAERALQALYEVSNYDPDGN